MLILYFRFDWLLFNHSKRFFKLELFRTNLIFINFIFLFIFFNLLVFCFIFFLFLIELIFNYLYLFSLIFINILIHNKIIYIMHYLMRYHVLSYFRDLNFICLCLIFYFFNFINFDKIFFFFFSSFTNFVLLH